MPAAPPGAADEEAGHATVIILLTYCSQLWSDFSSTALAIDELPAVPESMNVLLGISHAGYLTNKAIPKS